MDSYTQNDAHFGLREMREREREGGGERERERERGVAEKRKLDGAQMKKTQSFSPFSKSPPTAPGPSSRKRSANVSSSLRKSLIWSWVICDREATLKH